MLPVYLELDLQNSFRTSGTAAVCIICFKRITECKLQKCSSCKMVFYCGKEHQKMHWPKHKEFCKCVQLMFKENHKSKLSTLTDPIHRLTDNSENAFDSWMRATTVMKSLCEIYLKRELTQEETQLFFNQLICNVCYCYKENNMITCKDCGVSSYCSEEHQLVDKLQHSASCRELKFCLDFDTNCVKQFEISGEISDATTLPKNMQMFIDKYVVMKTKPHVDEPYVTSYLSNCLTVSLTLIYAIEKSNYYRGQETLNIHVVGSAAFESNAWWCWEYIFHYFKKLETVNFFFIGPESSNFFLPPVLTCQKCKMRRFVNFTVDNSFYHDFVKKNKTPPDVIIAYNCGFTENSAFPEKNTWLDSIPLFLKNRGSVIVFTSYIPREAEEDIQICIKNSKNGSLKILVQNEENPFKSLMPYNDCFVKGSSVYYNNNFINICSV